MIDTENFEMCNQAADQKFFFFEVICSYAEEHESALQKDKVQDIYTNG